MIGLPETANPLKVAAMKDLGAELVFHGGNFDEARAHCERLAREEGYRYVHAVNEPLLIAGVGTAALEIIEDLPDVQVLMVPLGGGSGVSGACIVANAINPDIEVIAVQSEAAPAGYLSWKEGEVVQSATTTFAEGIATASGYEFPQTIMAELLDDFVLVTDDDIRYAIGLLVEKAHTLAEGAGATALAGAVKRPELVKGKKVSITVSGANITADALANSLKTYQDRRRS
jgi:threonine dehydratase